MSGPARGDLSEAEYSDLKRGLEGLLELVGLIDRITARRNMDALPMLGAESTDGGRVVRLVLDLGPVAKRQILNVTDVLQLFVDPLREMRDPPRAG